MIKKRKMLMLGQFPPPVTGEGEVNSVLKSLLGSLDGIIIDYVNTAIVSSANDVGKISVYKILKMIRIYSIAFFKILKSSSVYITPGQTKFGLLRVLPILLLAKILKRKTSSHWHGYGILYCFNSSPGLSQAILNLASINIFLTHDLVMKLEEAGCEVNNFAVVPNYVREIRPVSQTHVSKERLSILFLGSLMDEKGFSLFLEAAQLLPDIDFVMCGTGSKESVDKATLCSTTTPNFSYRGLVTGHEKTKVLKESDVFVLQTHYKTEGVPLSILEAMSFSCAIVTTAHNGIPETLQDAAYYVKRNDLDSLVNALKDLASSRSKLTELEKSANERVRNFSFDLFQQRILSVLQCQEKIGH